MNRCIYLFIALLYISLPITAGAYYKQYTTYNGLISNTVYKAFKDHNGYMWFGTDRGVTKFDGQTFTSFTILDGLRDNEVFNFHEDQYNRLWLFTYNGGMCYIRNDSVFNSTNDPLLKNIPIISYLQVMSVQDDTTIYLCYKTSQIIKVEGKKVKEIARGSRPLFHVYGPNILYTPSSTFFRGDSIILISSGIKSTFVHDTMIGSEQLHFTNSPPFRNIQAVFDNSYIRLYDHEHLFFTDTSDELRYPNLLNCNFDNKNYVLYGTRSGLSVVNYVSGSRSKLFPDIMISSVARDAYGSYWIATVGNGIFCLNAAFLNMRYLQDLAKDKITICRNGQIFLSAKSSIYLMAPNTIKDLQIPFKNKLDPLIYYNNHLFFSDIPKTYASSRRNKTVDTLDDYTKYVYPYDKDSLLLIRGSGLYTTRLIGDKMVFINSILHHDKILGSAMNVKTHKVYLLFHDSVCQLTGRSYKKIFDAGGHVLNVFCLNNNTVFMITDRNTVIVYDENINKVVSEVNTGGLAIFELFTLSNTTYLLRSNDGYYILDYDSKKILLHLKKIEHPFSSKDVYFMYPFGDSILCNVNDHLCLFPKEMLYKKSERPSIFIHKIVLNNKDLGLKSTISLYRNRCNLNIQASTLYFNNVNNFFQYRILHNNELSQWYKNDGDNIGVLLSGFGAYNIDVRTITENGIASEIKTIRVSLLPPFYYSSWFIIFGILIAVAIIAWLVHLYIRRRKRIHQNELHYMQLEHKAINSLLNPHFIFNAINNIQNLVKVDERNQANDYLAMLSKLIRQNIENLNFDLISLSKELELVKTYIRLQNLRFDNQIALQINNNLPQTDVISIPPLLIHTFVENAIIHGLRTGIRDFAITIDLDLSTDDYLVITITDNGIGYDNALKTQIHNNDKTSMGISFTQRRLERLSSFYKLQYQLQIRDLNYKQQQGTEVMIILYSKFANIIPR